MRFISVFYFFYTSALRSAKMPDLIKSVQQSKTARLKIDKPVLLCPYSSNSPCFFLF